MVEVPAKNCICYGDLVNGLNGKFLIIDVRNPNELTGGVITSKRWLNVPFKEFQEDFKNVAEFKKKHNVEFADDGSDLVFNCGSGNRSSRALAVALENGCKNAHHFPGGYRKYMEEKSKE